MPRLFFGIRPSRTLRASLEKTLSESPALNPAALRVSKPENWHITVHYIGNVTSFAAKKIIERFRDGDMPHDGTIGVGGHTPLGKFGNETLYVHVRDSEGVLARARAHAQLVAPVKEGHAYHPHLTLARTKKSSRGGNSLPDFFISSFDFSFPGRELILFESVQTKGETNYVPLAIRRFSKGKTRK